MMDIEWEERKVVFNINGLDVGIIPVPKWGIEPVTILKRDYDWVELIYNSIRGMYRKTEYRCSRCKAPLYSQGKAPLSPHLYCFNCDHKVMVNAYED